MKQNYNKLLILFLIILIILGTIIRIAPINKDFSAEETEFVLPAESIKATGHPIFYQSEQNPAHIALWHPPMYIFLLSIIYHFSTSEIATRSVNIIFSLLTAILIFLFCINFIDKKRGLLIGLISTALFLTNFYVFSSSLLIDIDMLSSFFVFSFIFSILMHYKNQKNYFLYLAGASMLFGLANRYPIMILTYLFIGGYYLFNYDLRKHFKKYVIMGAISSICFLIVWTIYSTLIEPGNFLFFLTHNLKMGSEQVSSPIIYFGSLALNISQFIRLVTFPAVILMIWAFFHFSKEKSKLTKVLLLMSLPVFLFFLFIPRPAFGYPRYFISIFPAVFILMGIFLYKSLRETHISKKEGIILIFSFFISLCILITLAPQVTIYASNGLIKATNLPDFMFNILASIPLVFVFLAKKDEKRKLLILILITLLLSYSLYFDFKYISNESYIKETAQYLKEHTSENEVVIVPKAIGYYTDRKFYINDNYKPDLDFSYVYLKKYFTLSLENPKMDNEFFWPSGFYSGLYGPLPPEEELKRAVYVVRYNTFEEMSYETKIGDFYIYNIR